MGGRWLHFFSHSSSTPGPRTGTPPPNRKDRSAQHSPTTQYGPAAQMGPTFQQGPNTQQAPTAELGLLKLSFGDGGHAIHPSLAIGGSGNQLGPRTNGRDALALVHALKQHGQPLSAAIGGEGGGTDLPALLAILKEVRDWQNIDIHFGTGGNATSGNAASTDAARGNLGHSP